MDDKELIIAVIQKYERLQATSSDIPGPARANLKRGTKHSISSYLEDITAAFISDLLPTTKYELRIDQTFYFEKSKSQFRPDICIVKKATKGNVIVGFVEVKDSPNPFRWTAKKGKNSGVEYVKKRIALLDKFRGKVLKFKDADDEKNKTILVHPKAKIDMVLFSDALFSKENLEELINACDSKEQICLHILLRGYHPNVKNQSISARELVDKIAGDKKGDMYSTKSLKSRIAEVKEMDK